MKTFSLVLSLSLVGCSSSKNIKGKDWELLTARQNSEVHLTPDSQYRDDLNAVETRLNSDGFTFRVLCINDKGCSGKLDSIDLMMTSTPIEGQKYVVTSYDPLVKRKDIPTNVLVARATGHASETLTPVLAIAGTITFGTLPKEFGNLQKIEAVFDFKVGDNNRVAGSAIGYTYNCELDPDCHIVSVEPQGN